MKLVIVVIMLNAQFLFAYNLPFGLAFGMKRGDAEGKLAAFSTIAAPSITSESGVDIAVWTIIDAATDHTTRFKLKFDSSGLVEVTSYREGLKLDEFEIYYPKLVRIYNELMTQTGGTSFIDDPKHKLRAFSSSEVAVTIAGGRKLSPEGFFALVVMTAPHYHEKRMERVLDRKTSETPSAEN